MQFQPILNTIFSKFSGGACPLEGLKNFFSPTRGSKFFFRINFPPKQKILDRTLTLRTLRFHRVSHDGNVHVQYPVIIVKKRVQPSINHKLKALFEIRFLLYAIISQVVRLLQNETLGVLGTTATQLQTLFLNLVQYDFSHVKAVGLLVSGVTCWI